MEQEIKKDEVTVTEQELGKMNKALERMVKPHTKISREVTEKDIDRITEESVILYQLCFAKSGLYAGAWAMHHSQIDDKDPMKLFVLGDRRIILNAKIVRHSNYTKDSMEQCMSFPDFMPRKVPRWQKCEVEYQMIMTDPEKEGKFKLSSIIKDSFTGFEATIFQHEIDHGDAKFIYQLA